MRALGLALVLQLSAGCALAHQDADAGLDPEWRPLPGEVVLAEVRPNPARIGDVVELLGEFPGDLESTQVHIDTYVPIIEYSHDRITARVPEVDGFSTSASVSVRGVWSRGVVLRIDRPEALAAVARLAVRRVRRGSAFHLRIAGAVERVRIGGVDSERRRAPLGYVVVVPEDAPVGPAVPIEISAGRRTYVFEQVAVE